MHSAAIRNPGRHRGTLRRCAETGASVALTMGFTFIPPPCRNGPRTCLVWQCGSRRAPFRQLAGWLACYGFEWGRAGGTVQEVSRGGHAQSDLGRNAPALRYDAVRHAMSGAPAAGYTRGWVLRRRCERRGSIAGPRDLGRRHGVPLDDPVGCRLLVLVTTGPYSCRRAE